MTGSGGQMPAESGEPGDGGDDGDDDPPPVEELGPPTVRRLLDYQYTGAVRDLLGDASAALVVAPQDIPVSGMDALGAAQMAVTDAGVEQYEESALAAAAELFADTDRLFEVMGCMPVADDDEGCATTLIEGFGRRAFRRPLDETEVEGYLALFEDARVEVGNFYGGAFAVIATMLQSPHFLYMVEIGEPDGDEPGRNRLTGYEIASKMSFFLVGTTPDDELLDAAENGDLDTAKGIRAAAKDLVNRPGARDALDEFHIELLGLEGLDSLVKVPAAFPDLMLDVDQAVSVGDNFASSARGETLALLHDVIWDRDGDYRDVLTADYTFVNPTLEFFYLGTIPAPEADLTVFEQVELPPVQDRSGILGHVSLLSLLARSNRTSPTLRGKFLRQEILCDAIPPPPEDVEFDLPDDDVAPTMREKLKEHQENPVCGGCHVLLDDLGFALENYDGIGFYRTLENGYPIDASGELDDLGSFDGARELGEALAASPKVPACAVQKLFRHATGHVESEGEKAVLEDLTADFATRDYRFKRLMIELVASTAFRYVRGEK